MGLAWGLGCAILLYGSASCYFRRPQATPLDFSAIAAPTFVFLQIAIALLVMLALEARWTIRIEQAAWGYGAGLVFAGLPQVWGILRRECVHQFEIRELYPWKHIALRELPVFVLLFPTMAACEEWVFRGAFRLPQGVIILLQFLYLWSSSRRAGMRLLLSCVWLGLLHEVTGSLDVVIGAHASVHSLSGRFRSPGLFGAVYPWFEQVRWKNLTPSWQQALVEAAAGVTLLGLFR